MYDVYKNQKLDEITKACYHASDLVTVTQSHFAERIKPYCQKILAVIRNSIDYKLPCWNHKKIETKFTRIGWAAGVHHRTDVMVFESIPHLVNQKVGRENVKWNFYGFPPPGAETSILTRSDVPVKNDSRTGGPLGCGNASSHSKM